jgi:hypothetical protein
MMCLAIFILPHKDTLHEPVLVLSELQLEHLVFPRSIQLSSAGTLTIWTKKLMTKWLCLNLSCARHMTP